MMTSCRFIKKCETVFSHSNRTIASWLEFSRLDGFYANVCDADVCLRATIKRYSFYQIKTNLFLFHKVNRDEKKEALEERKCHTTMHHTPPLRLSIQSGET